MHIMMSTRVWSLTKASAVHWWQRSGHKHIATFKYIFVTLHGVKVGWHILCSRMREGERCVVGKSFYLTTAPLRVNSTSPKTRWFERQEMLAPTDLNRAGVLRVVQQPHSAIAFPVQTPDAAAHQSTQHLHGRLCTGPGRRAHSTYIQVVAYLMSR